MSTFGSKSPSFNSSSTSSSSSSSSSSAPSMAPSSGSSPVGEHGSVSGVQGEGRGTLKEKMKPNPLLISHRPVVDEVEAKRGIKPISKLQFVKHVDSMLKKERMSDHPSRVEGSFSFQFELLGQDEDEEYLYKCDEFEIQKKNRYYDVVPSSLTRVVLDARKNRDQLDYINANHVQGWLDGCVTQYIASQAPLDSTCDDHWQLVWEQKVELIVMLTKERERQMIKAHRYWPEEKTTQLYHEISVHHAQCGEEEGSMIRKFILTRGRESRTVHHIQHAEWPDHGALEVEDMVHLFNVYRRLRSKSSGPVLVHCSAGIGRTGTFIAIDMLLDNLAKHTTGTIDIFDLVQRLRKQRPGSVQTPVQYTFIHEFIAYCLSKSLFGVVGA